MGHEISIANQITDAIMVYMLFLLAIGMTGVGICCLLGWLKERKNKGD